MKVTSMVAAIRFIESSGAVILIISEGMILVIVVLHPPLGVTLIFKRRLETSPFYNESMTN